MDQGAPTSRDPDVAVRGPLPGASPPGERRGTDPSPPRRKITRSSICGSSPRATRCAEARRTTNRAAPTRSQPCRRCAEAPGRTTNRAAPTHADHVVARIRTDLKLSVGPGRVSTWRCSRTRRPARWLCWLARGSRSRALAETLWAAARPEDLLDVTVELERLRSLVAAVEAQVAVEVEATDAAKTPAGSHRVTTSPTPPVAGTATAPGCCAPPGRCAGTGPPPWSRSKPATCRPSTPR